MEFEISHITSYDYSQPAAEAYGEARLTPPNLPTQKVLSHEIVLEPRSPVSAYVDHNGNLVHFFSLPYRHQKLSITNRLVVQTSPWKRPSTALELSVQETRQILSSRLADVFDFLQPTEVVEIGKEAVQWAKKYLRGDMQVGEGLERLNEAIHDSFDYKSGTTDNTTSLSSIWKERKGVCQDFAHVGLSILRTVGLPARYVCGYIETDPPKNGDKSLQGAVATHAWIEVMVAGMIWVPIDPTNRQWCNERYVAMAYGRDFREASPLRGTFKGSGGQQMSVKVFMKRRSEKTKP